MNSVQIGLYEKIPAIWPHGGRNTVFLRCLQKSSELKRQIVYKRTQRMRRSDLSPVWRKQIGHKRLCVTGLFQCYIQDARSLFGFARQKQFTVIRKMENRQNSRQLNIINGLLCTFDQRLCKPIWVNVRQQNGKTSCHGNIFIGRNSNMELIIWHGRACSPKVKVLR